MSNDEFIKGEQKVTSAEDENKKLWREFDANYPPFTANLKVPCIVAAIVALIVGVIIFSIVFTNLPCAKEIMAWQEDTPEPEGAVKSAVIAIVVGVIAIIAAVVVVTLIARVVAKRMQAKNYISKKMRLFHAHERIVKQEKEEARKREEEQRKLDAIFTCKLCGEKLYVINNEGSVVDKSYIEKQYSVEVTGYNKAVLKPEYNTLEWKERTGQKITCGCRKCGYEISRSQDDLFTNVTIEKGSVITADAVKKTDTYKYVDTYQFRSKSDI